VRQASEVGDRFFGTLIENSSTLIMNYEGLVLNFATVTESFSAPILSQPKTKLKQERAKR
jgi:hypothetical protein